MAPLTADRNTPRYHGGTRHGPLAASVKAYAGALLMRNAAGYLVAGQTATGLVGVGRSEAQVDNGSGSAGDLSVAYRPGCFRFANSAAADEVTIADIGELAYAVDDQTVAKTDGTASRSPAGVIEDVDAQGVWIRLDEALTKAAATAAAAAAA